MMWALGYKSIRLPICRLSSHRSLRIHNAQGACLLVSTSPSTKPHMDTFLVPCIYDPNFTTVDDTKWLDINSDNIKDLWHSRVRPNIQPFRNPSLSSYLSYIHPCLYDSSLWSPSSQKICSYGSASQLLTGTSHPFNFFVANPRHISFACPRPHRGEYQQEHSRTNRKYRLHRILHTPCVPRRSLIEYLSHSRVFAFQTRYSPQSHIQFPL